MINLYQVRKKAGFILGKVFILSLGILIFQAEAKAQDIHFTQFDYNPLFLNPANTGNFIGDWRVAANYRNQWLATSTPYTTASVSADLPMYVMGRKIGVGILFLNDATGILGLMTNKLYASGAYGMEINNNYLNFGIQAGIVLSSIESGWGNFDYQNGTFDADNGELNDLEDSQYIDINIGATWKRNIHIFEPEVGINIMHVDFPNKSYLGASETEPIRLAFSAIAKTNISEIIYVTPKLYYSGVTGSSRTVIGAGAGYKLLGNRSSVKKVFGGFYVNNGLFSGLDAIMAQIGATVGRLDIALSYDLGVSELGQTNTMGSFEIALIYKSISTVLNSYSIPCERY